MANLLLPLSSLDADEGLESLPTIGSECRILLTTSVHGWTTSGAFDGFGFPVAEGGANLLVRFLPAEAVSFVNNGLTLLISCFIGRHPGG